MALPVKLAAKLEFDTSGFKRGADDANKSLARLKGSFEVDLTSAITTSLKALAGFTVALGGIGVAAVKASFDLNRSMADVASLMPGNTARVVELKSAVQELAVATGMSTADISKGLYQSVSAWGDTADTVARLKLNADLATAGVSTLKEAVDLTSAVTRAYGDVTMESTQHVADLSAKTVQLGQTTLPELAGSIGGVTPLASQLGVKMEELYGVFATATGVTGSASEVATQYRGTLQALLSPTADMTALMTELGFATGKELIEAEGFGGALKLIAEHAEESGEPLQKYISSIEGQTLAMFLAGEGAADYASKLEELNQADGTLNSSVKEQREGLAAAAIAWDRLQQAVIVALQKIGDVVGGDLKGVFDNIRQLIDDNDEAIAAWVKGAIAWVRDTLVPAIGGDSTAMKNLKASLDGFWPKISDAFVDAFTGIGSRIIARIKGELASYLPDLLGWVIETMKGDASAGQSFGNLMGGSGPTPPGGGAGGGADFARGGAIRGPGGPTSDLIPAMLSNGEYVVNAESAAAFRPLLERINAKRFAKGGPTNMLNTSITDPTRFSVEYGSNRDAMAGAAGAFFIDKAALEKLFSNLPNEFAQEMYLQLRQSQFGTLGPQMGGSVAWLQSMIQMGDAQLKTLEIMNALNYGTQTYGSTLDSMTGGMKTFAELSDFASMITRQTADSTQAAGAAAQALAASSANAATGLSALGAGVIAVGGAMTAWGALSQLEQQQKLAQMAGGTAGMSQLDQQLALAGGNGLQGSLNAAAGLAGEPWRNPYALNAALMQSSPWMNPYALQAGAMNGQGQNSGGWNVYLDGNKVGDVLQTQGSRYNAANAVGRR